MTVASPVSPADRYQSPMAYLSLDVVHQALHARLHAVGVLAWQQLGIAVPVQADAASQQLVELLHLGTAVVRVALRHHQSFSRSDYFVGF